MDPVFYHECIETEDSDRSQNKGTVQLFRLFHLTEIDQGGRKEGRGNMEAEG